jgi:menaquinone-dependent protoporphyrinogen IX oxidase
LRVVIVYDTETGATGAAAEGMAQVVRAAGHECTAQSVADADPRVVARAQGIAIGCSAKGSFVKHRPSEGALRFIEKLALSGKPVAVFATYQLAIGSTLRQMASAVEASGGHVTGMYQVRGSKAPDGFGGWVQSLAAGS